MERFGNKKLFDEAYDTHSYNKHLFLYYSCENYDNFQLFTLFRQILALMLWVASYDFYSLFGMLYRAWNCCVCGSFFHRIFFHFSDETCWFHRRQLFFNVPFVPLAKTEVNFYIFPGYPDDDETVYVICVRNKNPLWQNVRMDPNYWTQWKKMVHVYYVKKVLIS